MPRSAKKINKKSMWIGIALGTVAILFLIAFWTELGYILLILRKYTFLYSGPIPHEAWLAIFVLLFTVVLGLGISAIIWIVLVSTQALLPISNFYEDENNPKSLLTKLQEVYRVAYHLYLYITKSHGPAIFIQNGQELSTPEEKRRPGPGVLVIDFNSAVILEQQLPRASLMMPIRNLFHRFSELLGLSDPLEYPPEGGFPQSLPQRARGPGIVYTRGMERIRGVIDLRKQSRFASEVTAHTRDGIKITTNGVVTLFSVGEEPDVIQVTFLDGRKAEHLAVVSIKASGENLEITPLPNEEIDDADREAIFASISKAKASRRPYTEIPAIPLLPTFNAKRVFEAISSQAARGDTEIPWTDLPLQNAVKIFRDLISNYNYNLLSLDPEAPEVFNLTEINNRFRIKARNTGALNYRLVFHARGKLLEKGTIPAEMVRVSPVYPLPVSQQAVLRERGIKVIHAGFLPLRPVFEGVTRQRFDNWQADWESEIMRARAVTNLEARRVYNEALSNAQVEMITTLSEILNDGEYSQEAVALRVLQALESAAENPDTRRLVASDTINLMRAAYDWLPPNDPNSPNNFRPPNPRI